MKGHPEITVITIVYNGERYVVEAVDSILNQTYMNFEYVLVDNNSTDSTPKILADYAAKDERIKVINEPEQGGIYAYNAGLQAARGNWIAILDSDDVAVPERLECQLDFVKANPSVVLVGSGCTMIDENGKFLKGYVYPSDHETLLRCLEGGQVFFPHSSSFFRRQVAVELGGYRFRCAEDYDFCLRLSMRGRLACIGQPLIKLRRHVSSTSYTASQEQYLLFGLLGLVCHLRRKQGLSDPYDSGENRDRFLRWAKTRMKNLDCFSKGLAKRELLRIWYNRGESKLYRLSKILWKFLTDFHSRAYLLNRFFIRDAALQIAEESKSVF